MTYREYFQSFCANDNEEVIQWISNEKAEEFLLENAPRLYCPDKTIEEIFAFRTWTIRKHLKHTEDGYVLSEFLINEKLKWAGKHNTINAALTHHLNEYRWFKNASLLLDYIRFFLEGEGEAFAYYTPALTAIVDFLHVTGNEQFLKDHIESLERYFSVWEEKAGSKNGMYWSNDDREGMEYTIGGTTPDRTRLLGFRPLMNSCMYGDALTLAKVFAMLGKEEKQEYYAKKARTIQERVEASMWDGEFFKAVSPLDQDLHRAVDVRDIPEGCNAKELMGYIPWAYGLPSQGKEAAFAYLKDEKVFYGKTGFTTADMSDARFMFYPERGCTTNGLVFPYASSYALNAVIRLLSSYEQTVITDADLYDFILKYAAMHYSVEDGKKIPFIDENMSPYEPIWYRRSFAKEYGWVMPERGRDYNHSTFIDIVLRGLCGIDERAESLCVRPRIVGIWPWFKLENLTFRGKSYTVYYDETGEAFGKGVGVTIEET